MDHIVLLICLFPVVFMLHDFEEIVMQQRWMERNADELSRRFPVLRKQIMQLRELSTTAKAGSHCINYKTAKVKTGMRSIFGKCDIWKQKRITYPASRMRIYL